MLFVVVTGAFVDVLLLSFVVVVVVVFILVVFQTVVVLVVLVLVVLNELLIVPIVGRLTKLVAFVGVVAGAVDAGKSAVSDVFGTSAGVTAAGWVQTVTPV